MEQRYLPIPQTAEFLGVSKWTIYRLVKDQSIPYVPIRGRIVFDKEDLIAWMDKRKVPVKTAS
jgi:excisionase family DNA binding protein